MSCNFPYTVGLSYQGINANKWRYQGLVSVGKNLCILYILMLNTLDFYYSELGKVAFINPLSASG